MREGLWGESDRDLDVLLWTVGAADMGHITNRHDGESSAKYTNISSLFIQYFRIPSKLRNIQECLVTGACCRTSRAIDTSACAVRTLISAGG